MASAKARQIAAIVAGLASADVRAGRPRALRSPRWPKVRDAHLKRQPACQVCGSRKKLNVHHKRPFHLWPELELEPSNLITLCEGDVVNCHVMVGHLRDWKAYNPTVEEDAAIWREKIASRPAA